VVAPASGWRADQICRFSTLAQDLEDDLRTLPKNLYPRAEIARVILGAGVDFEPPAQQECAELGHEFLAGVRRAAHPAAQIAMQARLMPGTVARLVGPSGYECGR
jgi:hypothetical protein